MSEETTVSRGMAIKVGIGIVETSCWAVGLALCALYFSARADGELERRKAVSAFSQQLHGQSSLVAAQLLRVPPGVDANRAPNQVQWSAARIQSYAAAAAKERISAGLAAAVLRIPRVALEVPVYSDSSERNLNRGAGLIAGTGAPDSNGNIAIAAHRDGFFRALQNVAVGDLVELETRERRRQYRVIGLSIVDPTDVSPLHDTEVPALTLVTCYPFYFVGSAPQRYIVRAVALE